MYIPSSFAETDRETLHDLMRRFSFATLVTVENGVPVASHLPFLLDADRGEHGTLVGHVARANKQWNGFANQALVIFEGPHAYVSPRWFTSEPNVPTWNYAVVHAYGTPRAIDDPAAALDVVNRLSQLHENGRARPWSTADVPSEFVDRLLRAIVAFEVPIDRLEGKFKLSQNKSLEDRKSIGAALRAEGHPLGDLM